MTRFIFALEPLLKERLRNEQAAQRVVAQIERERITLENRIRTKQQAISQGKHELKGKLVGNLDLTGLRGHASSSLRLMRDAQREVLELAGIHKRLDLSRQKLLEASRRRRAVELLREKRFEDWKYMQEKRELAAQDELAVIAAARKEIVS